MAFIVLRRSRNTSGYYLVESYRDPDGRSRKRTLCYLGREQEGIDTLERAIDHWQDRVEKARGELRSAARDRKPVIRRRLQTAEKRLAFLSELTVRQQAAAAERQRQAEEAEHWHAFERLRASPSEAHAAAAKRAFLALAKRHHPDHGGSHTGFLHLKETYERSRAFWKVVAARR